MSGPSVTELWRPKWRGQQGRLEVWYATFSDAATGAGLWLHHETAAPTGGGPPTTRAWAAVFPTDSPPVWHRSEAIDLRLDGSQGDAGDISWRLRWDVSGQRPLWTFPRWAWQRELLPAAQVVPAPHLTVEGHVRAPGLTLDGWRGHGAVARIYGHGNAARWAWLHADLGGGDVLELVSAVSTRPGLRRLPPITHLRARVGGRDWPGLQGPSFGLRSRLDVPVWRVRGRVGRARVDIEVTVPADRSVAVGYEDPGGATATCTNTERADAVIEVDGAPFGNRTWRLDGTAHAEVGTRP